MKSTILSSLYFFIYSFLLFFILQSCSSQKETSEFSGMQNVTAKFNILYNSRILLEEIESNVESSHFDDYNQPLSVYIEPKPHSSNSQITLLDSVLNKANRIIEEKSASNYVDDAYLIIAKAQYLKANFFDAAEFFSYIYRTYPEERELRQTSLVLKSRAELLLGNLNEARKSLDSAIKYSYNDNRSIADIYATRAQLLIKSNNEEEAIKELQKAIDSRTSKKNRIRWRYLLGQLQLRKGDLNKASENFKIVATSNAPYEMSFNAKVNRIIIEDKLNGGTDTYISKLQVLLKDDKNLDFADQIFYRIAEVYQSNNQLKDALDNYNKAIQISKTNPGQKGLAYLRIADLYFNAAKYPTAKLYLDSTLKTLPPSYPDYEQIRKKTNNLDLLANRLQTIAHEEKLQALARLPESERSEQRRELEQPLTSKVKASFLNDNNSNSASAHENRDGKFYFNNSSALSQGLSDFKKTWGNRQLEDNWRRSEKISVNDANLLTSSELNLHQESSSNPSSGETIIAGYDDIPLTAEKLEQSNKKIINALYDIANFYKDELEDGEMAVTTFENLLNRFPDNPYTIAINYNLYRLYQSLNSKKADYYKNVILSKYPGTDFAKVIIDPLYVNKADDKEAALNEIYNEVYNIFNQKNYSLVIQRVKEVERQFNNNKLSPQFAYLKALSVGRTQQLPAFEDALKAIIKQFPDDQVVSPLVRQHLSYIEYNRKQFDSRKVALVNYSAAEKEFAEDSPLQQDIIKQIPVAIQVKPDAPGVTDKKEAVVNLKSETASKADTKETLFSLPDSAEYYFVVNVTNPSTNLSSSRFGIGQFNRTNLQGEPIKHQLMHVNNENQLILVGLFKSKVTVTNYERRILPLLKEIMKIPSEKYNTFVITKDGLDKLKDTTLISSYLHFYKNSH